MTRTFVRRLSLAVVCLLVVALPASAEDPPLPETVAEGAALEEVYGDERFFEGPTWDPQHQRLLFTAFGENTQILRLDEPGKVTVWLDSSEGVNGTYLSNDGRLLGAQAYGHRVMSYGFGPDGPSDAQVLYFDETLNQPNDVCQALNGDIYFTDPDFDQMKTSAVYRLEPEGAAVKIIDDMPVPNGLKTSLDGRTLVVGDSHLALWRAYTLADDGPATDGRVFFDPETERRDAPDGMALDEDGNYYLSGRGGVWVASPAGESLGLIPVPEFCSNVTFGGADGRTLYLTCSKKVYSLAMNVRGEKFKGMDD